MRVDDEWRAFARANGAPELAGPEALGRPLGSSCSDDTTTRIWALPLARARRGAPVVVSIRCDAPARRRTLRLELTHEQDGTVRFESRPLADDARPEIELLARGRAATQDLLVCCSWCKRFRLAPDAWAEVEELVAATGLLKEPALPALSHGICQDCVGRFRPLLVGAPESALSDGGKRGTL